MTVEEAVCTLLGTFSAVTNLVGTRIHQLKLPQNGDMPAIRVQLISEVTTHSHDGRDRTQRARIQVDCYAGIGNGNDPYADAVAVYEAMHGDGQRVNGTGLDAYQGDLESPPAFRFRAVLADGRAARFEEQELNLVRIRQDYIVHFYN